MRKVISYSNKMADLSNITQMQIRTIKKLVKHQIRQKNVAQLIYAVQNMYLFEQELESHNLSSDKVEDLVEYALEELHRELLEHHKEDLKKYI